VCVCYSAVAVPVTVVNPVKTAVLAKPTSTSTQPVKSETATQQAPAVMVLFDFVVSAVSFCLFILTLINKS